MKKPWETEELSEDWIDEGEENLVTKSAKKKSGYGTVKIATLGRPIPVSAIKTVQEGGTLVINDSPNDSLKSQSTIRADKEKHKWNIKNKDLFTPLILESMFEKPSTSITTPNKLNKKISTPLLNNNRNSPNLAPCLSDGRILGSPLRRISGNKGVHFKLNSRNNSPYSPSPTKLFPINLQQVPDRPHTAPQGLALNGSNKIKRSTSDKLKSYRLNHASLFQSQYDQKTEICLSQLLNSIDGNESDQCSISTNSNSDKGIKRMISAPNLNSNNNNSIEPRPNSFRMLTPHPPTWEWLKMQSETNDNIQYDSILDEPNEELSFQEELNEHDWLKDIAINEKDLSLLQPRSTSTLSKSNATSPNNQSQEILTNSLKEKNYKFNNNNNDNNVNDINNTNNSTNINNNFNNINNNVNKNKKNYSPISQELWEEFFKNKNEKKLGPDRVAEQLKKHGILPYYYIDSYPVLIQPHQLGKVPKLVNDMKFDSIDLKWKHIKNNEEDDPFKSIKTLKIDKEEFKNILNKEINNNITNNNKVNDNKNNINNDKVKEDIISNKKDKLLIEMEKEYQKHKNKIIIKDLNNEEDNSLYKRKVLSLNDKKMLNLYKSINKNEMINKSTQTEEEEIEIEMDVDFKYWNFIGLSFNDLAYLKLNNSNIKNMKAFASLINLRFLNLSHNRLSAIIGNFPNLLDLDVSFNNIDNIQSNLFIKNMNNLNRFRIGNNSLKQFIIKDSGKLTILDIKNNPILIIKGKYINLTKLNISNTKIIKLPCIKLFFEKLNYLIINHLNQFNLPHFNDLKKISYIECKYSTFNLLTIEEENKVRSSISKLKYLIIKGSPNIFPILSQWPTNMLINLEYMDISETGLTQLPKIILNKAINLIALECNDNKITMEKEQISKSIKYLSLKNNLIESMNPFLNLNYKGLKCLDLRFNPITLPFAKHPEATLALQLAFKGLLPGLVKFQGKRID